MLFKQIYEFLDNIPVSLSPPPPSSARVVTSSFFLCCCLARSMFKYILIVLCAYVYMNCMLNGWENEQLCGYPGTVADRGTPQQQFLRQGVFKLKVSRFATPQFDFKLFPQYLHMSSQNLISIVIRCGGAIRLFQCGRVGGGGGFSSKL